MFEKPESKKEKSPWAETEAVKEEEFKDRVFSAMRDATFHLAEKRGAGYPRVEHNAVHIPRGSSTNILDEELKNMVSYANERLERDREPYLFEVLQNEDSITLRFVPASTQ